MYERSTLIRSLHDVGLAAWFGGSLMGAVGLNGAAEHEGGSQSATDRISSSGWARWTPVNAAAIGTHLFGGGGLLAANAGRLGAQRGVAGSSAVKTALTAGALAATAYSGFLGRKVALASSTDPEDAEKAREHPVDLDQARQRLTWVQWAVPALTGSLLVLNAFQGEQQRPAQQLLGTWRRARAAAPFLP
ncbi:hypothetical protein C6N75_07465 [Streptomyces solincola]|uniref:Uncharacterized protein n=1 Tax=Streptomyces solincola TaxID=2100817 RepID=A0A2S9PZR2_9ACTN|nr:hypothetical protein [Streptomyces solincola]PRH79833.1 hypothetical protein C6N75_07465 [Streptomyces solincola]